MNVWDSRGHGLTSSLGSSALGRSIPWHPGYSSCITAFTIDQSFLQIGNCCSKVKIRDDPTTLGGSLKTTEDANQSPEREFGYGQRNDIPPRNDWLHVYAPKLVLRKLSLRSCHVTLPNDSN